MVEIAVNQLIKNMCLVDIYSLLVTECSSTSSVMWRACNLNNFTFSSSKMVHHLTDRTTRWRSGRQM